jgi:hypothetical protein
MATAIAWLGRIALCAGLAALGTVATRAWFHYSGLPDLWAPLIGYGLLLLFFKFAVPILCGAALAFGFLARSRGTALAGMAAAVLALLGYGLLACVGPW